MKFVAIFLLALSGPAFGQVELFHPATDPLPSFEVAAIRLNGPAPVMGSPAAPDTVHLSESTRNFIRLAFGVPFNADRILGGPKWLDDDRYTLDAKIPLEAAQAEQKMTREERQALLHMRKQTLLRDRFHLKMHFEKRDMPVFELVVTSNNAKLTPTDSADTAPKSLLAGRGKGPLALVMKAHAVTLTEAFQQPYLGLDGRPVIDKTGLTGKFDFTLEWTVSAQNYRPAPGSEAPPVEDGPTIFTAVQEQLGLKLVPAKDPVEVLVIDGIELPSEN